MFDVLNVFEHTIEALAFWSATLVLNFFHLVLNLSIESLEVFIYLLFASFAFIVFEFFKTRVGTVDLLAVLADDRWSLEHTITNLAQQALAKFIL